MSKRLIYAGIMCCLVVFVAGQVSAADMKIGVMNVQKVLVESVSGKSAKAKFDDKMQELQNKFKTEEDELIAMQKDIEKKSSAWSEETKQTKAREFQKKRRELQDKSEDARFELKTLQDKELAPILKALEGVVTEYGKKNGYTMILDSKSGVVYFSEAVDITDQLVKELDAAMAAK
ncbi:MAG: OmpH family outer membrane protein [Desulfofustis sp.]|jgi:outer membrane protein|nr:OmpH family outer membrane protein [Desulfofustis sp.]